MYGVRPSMRAKQLLQIIRHGLVVKQMGLTGIEYSVRANHIASTHLGLLHEALRATGVPYVLRISKGGQVKVKTRGLDLAVDHRAEILSHRTRPLPALSREPDQDLDWIDSPSSLLLVELDYGTEDSTPAPESAVARGIAFGHPR